MLFLWYLRQRLLKLQELCTDQPRWIVSVEASAGTAGTVVAVVVAVGTAVVAAHDSLARSERSRRKALFSKISCLENPNGSSAETLKSTKRSKLVAGFETSTPNHFSPLLAFTLPNSSSWDCFHTDSVGSSSSTRSKSPSSEYK
ncbi:hypothetical protein OGAPHI_006940 [Ogataea philodendri]|uniref:Uncharacterized protein n=1 Tax=Ogataea philodendri TaxID=1378263 RepID=A0A9P8NVT0_9ASCO|nr:uncharacterized protein OGAPHI_006940 [Ogataea philodendri]KAH3660354.1 hypothetical protein OGAPHI_006940 [Ogataea philodendri]